MFKKITLSFIKVFLPFIASVALAQIEKAPNRAEGEYANRTIIRGVTLINSTGAPPIGPIDIVIEKNKISQIARYIHCFLLIRL